MSFRCKTQSLRCLTVSTVTGTGNTERAVISSYEALNTARLIKRADLFTSFIKYSLLLKVFQNAYHTRIAFL